MLQTAFGASCMNQASVFEWHKTFKEGRESVRDYERCGRSEEVNTPEMICQWVRVRVTMLRFEVFREFKKRFRRSQHSSNRVCGISTWTIHQSTSLSLSQTIWPRWASRQLLSLPIVQTLLPVNLVISWAQRLSLWDNWVDERGFDKGHWHSHTRSSMGPFRSCWNRATCALQLEEITSKEIRVSCVYYQWKCLYEKSLEPFCMHLVYIYVSILSIFHISLSIYLSIFIYIYIYISYLYIYIYI